MKIFRFRRGFSTNCSGANEYFPSGGVVLPPPVEMAASDSDPNDPNAPVISRWVLPTVSDDGPPVLSRWVTRNPDGRPWYITEPLPSWTNESTSATTVSQPDTGRAASQSTTTSNNGLILGLVLAGVLVLFGAERAIRAVRRRSREAAKGERGGDDEASS